MQHDFHFISKKDPKIKKAYNDILNKMCIRDRGGNLI